LGAAVVLLHPDATWHTRMVPPIAPPMGAFHSHPAATPLPRERQVPLDMDAINFEG